MISAHLTAVLKALDIADEEAEKGNNVLIMLPCRMYWFDEYRHAVRMKYGTDPALPESLPPGIYVRYSTSPASLKAILVDVLIIVGIESPRMDYRSLQLVRERQRASIIRKEIVICPTT